MIKNNKIKSITKDDLNDLFDKLDKSFDIKLGKFTDDVLLPAISEIISGEIGKYHYEMKSYIDNKLSENKGDIISFIKGDKERDKIWEFMPKRAFGDRPIKICQKRKITN